MVVIGINQIISQFVELFGVIYTTGQMLFGFLSTPLADTGSDYVSIFGDLAYMTPFELMFGVGLIVILILALVKFLMPI